MTIVLIIITVAISVLAFQNRSMFIRLQFNPYQVFHRREYYRILSHGFIHANWWHLFVNMFVLYFFGSTVELYLGQLAANGIIRYPVLIFIVFYLLAIVFAASMSLYRHRDDPWYNSVGASGAVSAVLFFSIFFDPWNMIGVYFIPVPGIIFAVLYVAYSHYQSKRGGDNIAHDAHLLGAVFGFVFPLFLELELIRHFISKLLMYA
ncbi:MAG: rhomboid family intramembrane serine protease [Bacteroidota bacterium]|nr:MAG: rhomboid family intramembrane serine protease [Bacteroidota bacterium]